MKISAIFMIIIIACCFVLTTSLCPKKCKQRRCLNRVMDRSGCCEICVKKKAGLPCGGRRQRFGVCDERLNLVCMRRRKKKLNGKKSWKGKGRCRTRSVKWFMRNKLKIQFGNFVRLHKAK